MKWRQSNTRLLLLTVIIIFLWDYIVCRIKASHRTHDVIITLLLRKNDVVTSFWRNNDVIITACFRWAIISRTPTKAKNSNISVVARSLFNLESISISSWFNQTKGLWYMDAVYGSDQQVRYEFISTWITVSCDILGSCTISEIAASFKWLHKSA